jgi:hypothetical protein
MPFPVLKINVLQKYNRRSELVLLQLLNGSMNSILYRVVIFWALAVTLPAMKCHAQAVHPSSGKKSWLPAKKYTLADPEKKVQKAKPILQFYPSSFTHSVRPGEATFTGMQNLGWGSFCFAEYRFRQTTKIPLYVRLGSVEQANRLEGK